MHGQLPRNLEENLVDNKQSYRWLKCGDIKGERESTIVAAQDQAISTNYFRNKIWRKKLTVKTGYVTTWNDWPPHLRMLYFGEEWILNETRWSLYTFALLNMQSPRHWNDRQRVRLHTPKQVYEQEEVTLLRNKADHIDRKVTVNGHDIIITNKKRENMRTDRCGSAHRQKCVQKEAEKKLKYKCLCIEIQRMWFLKCKIIPVIIRATGVVTKVWKKNSEAMLGNHSVDSL